MGCWHTQMPPSITSSAICLPHEREIGIMQNAIGESEPPLHCPHPCIEGVAYKVCDGQESKGTKEDGEHPQPLSRDRKPSGTHKQARNMVTQVASTAAENFLLHTKQTNSRLAQEARRLLTARTRLRRSSNFSSASRSFCTSSKRLINSAANFSGSTWISFGIRYVRWRKNIPGVSKRCTKITHLFWRLK